MIQFANADKPTHHTINVRVSEGMTPIQFVRAMFSKDAEEELRFDVDRFSPTVCRIDFADQVLSQELMQIIEQWNSALIQPAPIFGFLLAARKYSRRMRIAIEVGLPIISAILFLSLFYHNFHTLVSGNPASSDFMYRFAYWIFGFYFVTYLTSLIGK